MQVVNERLESKTFESLLKRQLINDYSLSKAESSLLARDLTELLDSLDVSHIKPGQIVLSCVSIKEGPSKSINECSQVKVVITLIGTADTKHNSIGSLRRERIERITKEAYSQGGLLTQEDLSAILCCDIRTIRRDIAYLKSKNIFVPTRGLVKDIGRFPSHKTQAIKLFLEGKQFSEITRALYHSPTSILRYLRAFSLIATLKNEGLPDDKIISMNLASESLVREYLSIYNYYHEKYPDKLKLLKKKIGNKKGGLV
jgi:hypothetical protein